MLVLARRPTQKLIFPTINATVEVVQVRGQTVRLGIVAPEEVPVVREEIFSAADRVPAESTRAVDDRRLAKLRHMTRNHLHLTSVGLALLRAQFEQGRWGELEATLDRLEDEVAATQGRYESLEIAPDEKAAAPRAALLVEDDRNERELLAGLLRLSGFNVATASDGAEALEYLSNQGRPDVMLLDMMMPRCDGPTTVRQIRANPEWEGLKIFAVSGASRSELHLDIGPAGLDGWFSKPVNPQTLVRKLSDELAASRA